MTDDEIPNGVWRIDDETRLALRLQAVERAWRAERWDEVACEAEELLDESQDQPEALYYLADASLALGQPAVAVLAFEDRLRLAAPDAACLLGLAQARFDLCEMDAAAGAALHAAQLDPHHADAHFTAAQAFERLGRAAEAAHHLAQARALAPERYPPPVQLDERGWERLRQQALSRLHPDLAAFWRGVPMRWEHLPPLDELRRASPVIRPSVGGLYVGQPPEAGDPWRIRPEALRLFRGNLSRGAGRDDIVLDLAETLETEALSWLGLHPEDLQGGEE